MNQNAPLKIALCKRIRKRRKYFQKKMAEEFPMLV